MVLHVHERGDLFNIHTYTCRGLRHIVREVSAIRGRSCVAGERRSDPAPIKNPSEFHWWPDGFWWYYMMFWWFLMVYHTRTHPSDWMGGCVYDVYDVCEYCLMVWWFLMVLPDGLFCIFLMVWWSLMIFFLMVWQTFLMVWWFPMEISDGLMVFLWWSDGLMVFAWWSNGFHLTVWWCSSDGLMVWYKTVL